MKYPKMLFFALLLSGVLAGTDSGRVMAQNNPVIKRVADAGVINFNGKYYLAGVSTNGGFYVSSDLVKWEGPVHVFSMNNEWTRNRSKGDDQIHAADIHYWNGKFHFYWSVNYWGLRDMTVHIGHSVSDNILGPYVEPVKDSWFDDRIDAELFVDDDSTFYFYTVKFTDGNTIWGQPMKDPSRLTGEPELIFTALPGTWEQYDNKVIEGPWVIKYRSRYYMMYNANHTSNQYGNYALGVAESDKPLGFNSGNKYSKPVVQSNLTDDPSLYRYYLRNSVANFDNWLYTTDRPEGEWMKADFRDSEWTKGSRGFGSQEIRGSSIFHRETEWTSQDIWVRKKFSLEPPPTQNLQLLVNHTGPTEIFINGESVYVSSAANYSTIDLSSDVIQKLKKGDNLISIHSTRGLRSAFLDVEFVDPLTKKGDDILFNPGQPNIVRGPNGFEWWLVYFGIKNGEGKGQFVSRVNFMNRELTVDGPTGSRTEGYHPDPSIPVFGDVFEYPANEDINMKWTFKSGSWHVSDNELNQVDPTVRAAGLIKSHSASNYLFKTGIKNNTPDKGSAGAIGYYLNEKNYLETGFDAGEHAWYYIICSEGKREKKKFSLAREFSFNVFHSISVLKNNTSFEILIDDNPAPGNIKIMSTFIEKGVPGLFSQNCGAVFDGVIYTPGWDEFDSHISGWSNSEKGEKMTGQWKVSDKGIFQTLPQGANSAFKGDLLDQYEFGAQIYAEESSGVKDKSGSAGIYPVYTDRDNYLKSEIDFKNSKLLVSGKIGGKETVNQTIPLKRSICLYPDPKYGDAYMKYYSLKMNSEISEIQIVKSIYDRRYFQLDLFESLKIFYRNNGIWHPLEFRKATEQSNGIDRIVFDRITADAIKLVSAAADNNVHVYKIYVTEEKTTDYNLRSIKLKESVILFLDGRQIAEIKGSWPASQAGLFTSEMVAGFSGITLFEKK